MDDHHKLELAKLVAIELIKYYVEKDPNAIYAMQSTNLLGLIVPSSIHDQKAFFYLITTVLDEISSIKYPPSFFFDFNVGGSEGTELSHMVNRLSHVPNFLTPEEKQDLIYLYPGLLLTGTSFNRSNFNATSEDLEVVLQRFLGQTAAIKPFQESALVDVLNVVSGRFGSFSNLESIVTPKSKALAIELLSKLDP